MVAQLLRLRLDILANSLRGGRRAIGGRILLLIGCILAGVLAIYGLHAAIERDPAGARDLAILGGSLVVLGSVLLPLILRREDDLSPQLFSVLGWSPRRIAGAVPLAALIGIPGIVLTLVSVSAALLWDRGAAAVLWAVLAAFLGILTVVLCVRLAVRAAESIGSGPGARAVSVLALLVLLTAGGLVFYAVAGGTSARLLGWSPLGAAWALPGDLFLGSTATLWGHLVVALGTVILLGGIWYLVVVRAANRPSRSIREGAPRLGWFAVFRGGQTASIAARSFTYWTRDARYLTPLLIVPAVPLASVFALSIAGVPWTILGLLPLPMMVIFWGWAPHNDLASDSSALWLHVVSGVGGRADRIGRIIPVLIVGIPLIVIGAIISVALIDRWELFPALLGVCAALFLGGLGLSSYVSVRWPYPAVQPGDSPFQQPQSGGGHGAGQAVSLLGTALVAAPAVWFLILAASDASWSPVALGAGLAAGVLCGVLGILAGARYYDRNLPELMEFAARY